MQLKGKNILITGGGKGIGFSTVIEALKEGAFVYTIVKSKKDLKKFENLSNLKIFVGNVTNEKLMAKVFKTSYKNNKPITGLVNNAGIRQRMKFGKLSRSNIRNIFDVNFFSVFNLMQIFSKYLVKKKTFRLYS